LYFKSDRNKNQKFSKSSSMTAARMAQHPGCAIAAIDDFWRL
jgi:hypothetical protein